jgi:hypothetical protein
MDPGGKFRLALWLFWIDEKVTLISGPLRNDS